MATYSQIQEYIKQRYGYTCKTCWIAHMKEVCGLNPRKSHNRYDSGARSNPCPIDKQQDVINAFKHFGMISSTSTSASQGCATTILIVLFIISAVGLLLLYT